METALTAQPDPITLINTITFQCNGTATIQVREVFINQPTSIDGANVITLANAPGNLSMFVVNGTFFYLNNVVLRNTTTPGPQCTNWLNGCGGSVVYGVAVAPSVELHHTRVEASVIPISMLSGSLGIYDSQFTGNSTAVIVAAPGIGPGNQMNGVTSVVRSIFQNNPGAAPIQATGTVSITDTQFINSGATVLEACKATIQRSVFQGNATNGALQFDCDGSISNSVFKDSVTQNVGGAISIGAKASSISLRSDRFLNNSAFRGGAIHCFWAPTASSPRSLTITYSTFTGNHATLGGAILVGNSSGNPPGSAAISIKVTSFSHNSATDAGGAIYATSSELQIARGAFADNSAAGNGGAIFLSNSSPLRSIFANTLFVRNHATSGSAFFGDGANFINSTVDSNVGLAIANQAPHPPVHIKLRNSIVSNNRQGGCGPTGLFDDASPSHNLQFPSNDCGASIAVADPHLDTMYIPIPKSPPMGNGDLSICMSSPVNGRDVYGLGRPSGNNCTIGAAEGDIQVLVYKRTPKTRGGKCDCGTSLLQQLQKALLNIR